MSAGQITAERLREVLRYEPESGRFSWIVAAGRVVAGEVAGTIQGKGYRSIKIDRRAYRANRLAVLYVTGEWPAGTVDHRNGVRSDDRWDNLRTVSHQLNCQNQRRAHRSNRTGLLGVSRRGGRFEARITIEGKLVYLGYFPTAQEAHVTYLSAKRRHHAGNTL